MKSFAFLFAFLLVRVAVIEADEDSEIVPSSFDSFIKQYVLRDQRIVDEARGSPAASIAAYITNYWEKKKQKKKTKKPIHHKKPSCFYYRH